jgi:hypothetical protein
MREDLELFGSPDRAALALRSAQLWTVVRGDPRYAYYGRLVGLSAPETPDMAERMQALANLQGVAVSYFYPAERAEALRAELVARGLEPDRHEHYLGREASNDLATQILGDLTLPEDLTVGVVDQATPGALLQAIAEMSEASEVMPVPGLAMRGRMQPGICLYALDAAGAPVATASSFMLHHPQNPNGKVAFWGMLATRPDRRGEKIGLILGAMAIRHMWDRHGARGFMTGVRADNPSSQALCAKLGVLPSDWIYASCLDRSLFTSARVIK